MSLKCYRCGTSLDTLSLPLSRLETCPECRGELHVCCMCVYFAPHRSPRCSNEDAEEVRDARSANFCDFFVPSPEAYTLEQREAETAAADALAHLFDDGEREGTARSDAATGAGLSKQDELARREAESLFKK